MKIKNGEICKGVSLRCKKEGKGRQEMDVPALWNAVSCDILPQERTVVLPKVKYDSSSIVFLT